MNVDDNKCAMCHDLRPLEVVTDPETEHQLCRECWDFICAFGDTNAERRERMVAIAKGLLDGAARGMASDNELTNAVTILRVLGET